MERSGKRIHENSHLSIRKRPNMGPGVKNCVLQEIFDTQVSEIILTK